MTVATDSQSIEVGSGIRWYHVASFFIGLGILLAVLLFVSDGPRVEKILSNIDSLKVDTVEIQSDWPLVPAQVKSWFAPLEGKSILLVNAHSLISQIEKHPWVDAVSLKKEYPNRIRILVSTKKPMALSLVNGQPYFLDSNGSIIEKESPGILRTLDLPFVSQQGSGSQWNIARVLQQYEKLKKLAAGKITVSQIVLGTYPFFKTFLSHPKMEVVWSVESWEAQLPNLLKLIANPPSQIGQLQRINLVFSKKAIVSSPISH